MTILTNTGRFMITGALVSSPSAIKWVGWGVGGSTAEGTGNTSLASEVNFSGTSGSSRSGTNSGSQQQTTNPSDTYQLVNTISASAAVTISEAGLFDSTTSGNLMIRGTFSGIPLNPGDSIQFTFKLQFT